MSISQVRPSKEAKYFKSLDFLRFLAAILVVSLHYGSNPLFFKSSFLAVDFFFVLSGFILSHVYYSSSKRLSTDQFVSHRLARLYPLHILTMCIMFFTWVLFNAQLPPRNSFYTAFCNLLLIQNVGLTHNYGTSWNTPAWSISTEIATNIIFFAIPALRKNIALIIIIFSSALILALNAPTLEVNSLNAYNIINLGMVRCIFSFSIGIVTNKIYQNYEIIKSSTLKWSLYEILALILVFIPISSYEKQNNLSFPLAAALLVLIYAREKGLISKIISYTRIYKLGLISFTIYLLHIPFRTALRFTDFKYITHNIYLSLLILSLLSVIIYFYFEKPLSVKLRNAFTIKSLTLSKIINFTFFIFLVCYVISLYSNQ